jgi:hypothetical protein
LDEKLIFATRRKKGYMGGYLDNKKPYLINIPKILNNGLGKDKG